MWISPVVRPLRQFLALLGHGPSVSCGCRERVFWISWDLFSALAAKLTPDNSLKVCLMLTQPL